MEGFNVFTREDIRELLEEGQAEGATHTLVCVDSFDGTYYPVHVKPGQSPEAIVSGKAGSFDRVLEVYAHHLDLDEQLKEKRAWHIEQAPAGKHKKQSPRRGRLSDLAE